MQAALQLRSIPKVRPSHVRPVRLCAALRGGVFRVAAAAQLLVAAGVMSPLGLAHGATGAGPVDRGGRSAVVSSDYLQAQATFRAADPQRGRALYENRCGQCHSQSVHNRLARRAVDFSGILDQVRRWDRNLGGDWSEDDIADVTVFLNMQYYKYPCPAPLCTASQAGLGTGAKAWAVSPLMGSWVVGFWGLGPWGLGSSGPR
jgi:hypothetical protein